jgi:hypothetical protein
LLLFCVCSEEAFCTLPRPLHWFLDCTVFYLHEWMSRLRVLIIKITN